MRVLVAYASRHGATAGIATRIGETLAADGVATEVTPVSEVRSLEGFDAVVVGSSAYFFHWEKAATTFVRRNAAVLAAKPVWLFSSGPLGTDPVDKDGRDALESSVPREFAEFRASIHPRDERVFFGAYDASAAPTGLGERLTKLMPAARDALPVGDFRDWPAIEAWAHGIELALRHRHPDATAQAPGTPG